MTFAQFVREHEEVLRVMYNRTIVPSGSKATFQQFCLFVYNHRN